MKDFNYYEPIWSLPAEFIKPPQIIYYELRVWKNHDIIEMSVFTALNQALKYYKKHNFKQKEEQNKCYVEIVKIKNLNPRYYKK